jgi:hypothetical protein
MFTLILYWIESILSLITAILIIILVITSLSSCFLRANPKITKQIKDKIITKDYKITIKFVCEKYGMLWNDVMTGICIYNCKATDVNEKVYNQCRVFAKTYTVKFTIVKVERI